MTELVKELPARNGAIGYTDFTAIYIRSSVHGNERGLVRKHELSHIWLQHNLRGIDFEKHHKNVDHYLLNVAMDLEIAKHLYDNDDLGVIERPRSSLMGAITQKHCEKYPSCMYFEEYYLELEKQKNNLLKSFDAKHNKFSKSKKSDKKRSKESIVSQAVEKAKKLKKHQTVQKIQGKLDQYRIKPSLASEIDAVAGRQKIVRIDSYRRPSRNESLDFFKKGRISKRKTPKITIYVDRSGSFDSSKTAKATETLKKILSKYRGQVRADALYFNDNLTESDPKIGNGGTNHQIVVDEIVKSNSELSIIITDDDDGLHTIPNKLPKTIIIPVGCNRTAIADKLGIIEVSL